MIKRLAIEDFRILQNVMLQPSASMNVLFGDNAAGKTSVLEAIHVLATGRSFRSANLQDLARQPDNRFQVVAWLEQADGREIPVGFQRQGKQTQLRAEGRMINRMSELSSLLAVQAIHPDSHILLSGGPKQRRRFLDWGVFHVEPQYLEVWRRYDKALKQRNTALRRGDINRLVQAWDATISEAARLLHQMRQQYLHNLAVILPEYAAKVIGDDSLSVEYQPGWEAEQSLQQVLATTLEKDRRRGFTCSGPHRAELLIRMNDQPVQHYLSRGQQKIVAFALLLSQVQLYNQQRQQNCLLLLDDLAAELDQRHQQQLLSALQSTNVQTFITSLTADAVELANWGEVKQFHVEQGAVVEVL